MKTFYISFFSCLVIACNNAADAPKTTSTETSTSKTEEPARSVNTGACSKLIFFQQGAEVETTSYNDAGSEISKQLTKVQDVKNENGMTVAYVEGTDRMVNDEAKPPIHYNYKCDGDKIYFDIASMFRTEKKEGDANFESGSIEYPINVKEGETLPDATGVMRTEKDGKKMEMKYHFKERKVEGKEEVTTPAGTWNCYKISYVTEVDMEMPGMDEKSKLMMKKMKDAMKNKTITWFAPDFGVVKMEMYMNDKLTSRNEITSVKR